MHTTSRWFSLPEVYLRSSLFDLKNLKLLLVGAFAKLPVFLLSRQVGQAIKDELLHVFVKAVAPGMAAP
jgi:hypothetical protein